MAAVQRSIRRLVARADSAANALYTWRYNPLYHSGALVVVCFAVLTATGLYLLVFYRIGAPYASVERITGQAWTGRWIRSLHRYASDLAIVAALVHALRMFAHNRTWGPRALAWVSGVLLLGTFLVCGWTGFVMVWDGQALLLASEGARLFDVIPIFSEPLGRAFVGEQVIPSAFFFLNLFAHIAIPVGILLMLWVHVSRLARSNLWPPRRLLWGTVALFTGLSVVMPVGMAPSADLLRLPGAVELDLFYAFWLPLARRVPPGLFLLFTLGLLLVAVLVPVLARPSSERAPRPSYVNPRFCTGCEQCYHDCPYEAIRMVPRSDGRIGYVGLVDPDKCVSCGICAGSCAPMGVGPEGRTGRDQLVDVSAFIAAVRPTADDVVVVGCRHGAVGRADSVDGCPVHPVSCGGALHSSVVEYLVRAGAGGVLIAVCPPRDCWNREGVTLLEARVHHGREAELKERVDRRRVRIAHAGEGERGVLARELALFRSHVSALDPARPEESIEMESLCEVPEVSVAVEDSQ